MSNLEPKTEVLPRRLTGSKARAIAEARWGRGGTHAYRTNTAGAYYYACSGHGGYVVDGGALTAGQRAQIELYVKPELATSIVRPGPEPGTEVVDLLINPFSYRKHSYRYHAGQRQVEHPVYLFEEDCDWAVLEKLTPIRLVGAYKDPEAHERAIDEMFDRHYSTPRFPEKETKQAPQRAPDSYGPEP